MRLRVDETQQYSSNIALCTQHSLPSSTPQPILTMDDPNNQMDSSRPVRILTMLTWIFPVALAIPYSADNNVPLPAIGVLPMTISACVAIFTLTGRPKRSRGVTIALDIFCASFLFGIFIPSIVILAGSGYSESGNQTVLGTLGAAPMMLNL